MRAPHEVSPIESVSPITQSATAYAALWNRIVVGELSPGTLVTERGLVQTLGVGKTPVREALARLVADGFVDAMPRRGYVVTALTLADVDELFELWRVIGPETARLACERRPGEVASVLTAHLEVLGTDLDAGRSVFESLAAATGNRRLVEANRRLFQDLYRFLFLAYNNSAPKRWLVRDLREMRDAIVAGDIVAAVAAYCRSIDDGAEELRLILSMLPSVRSASLTA